MFRPSRKRVEADVSSGKRPSLGEEAPLEPTRLAPMYSSYPVRVAGGGPNKKGGSAADQERSSGLHRAPFLLSIARLGSQSS